MGSLYVYTSVFIAQLSFLIGSTCVTWSSPMLLKLNGTDDNPLGRRITSTENSWLASISTLGACIGSILCGILASNFGRKTLLIATAFPFVVFNLVFAWATNIWFFYVSRFFTGMGLGAAFAILPIYSTEVAEVKNRGILGASMAIFINLGLLLPYCVGPYIPFFWFHIILAIIPAIFIPLFYFCAPESPYFLMKNNPGKARAVLEKIRNKAEVDENFEGIKRDLENDSKGSLMDIFHNKGLRKSMLIALGLITFMQLTGTAVVASYTQTIFADSGSDISADVCSIIIGVTQLITTIIVSPVADRFPRKLMLITSHLGVAIMEIPLGIYFILKDNGNDVTTIKLIPLISLVLYVVLYNCGIGPIVMTSLGELFPLAVKGKAVATTVVYVWSLSFLITFLFNTLKDSCGTGEIFLFFSVIGFIGAVFIKTIMIETKGKTFEEIQNKLNS